MRVLWLSTRSIPSFPRKITTLTDVSTRVPYLPLSALAHVFLSNLPPSNTQSVSSPTEIVPLALVVQMAQASLLASWFSLGPLRVSRIALYQGLLSTFVSVRSKSFLSCVISNHYPTGLQIQQTHNKIYSGPGDAIKKIISSHGIAGLYKGQVATLYREAVGYGAYFWAYEKLMQREITKHGIRRDQVSPVKAVLFGASAGYAVRLIILMQVVRMNSNAQQMP